MSNNASNDGGLEEVQCGWSSIVWIWTKTIYGQRFLPVDFLQTGFITPSKPDCNDFVACLVLLKGIPEQGVYFPLRSTWWPLWVLWSTKLNDELWRKTEVISNVISYRAINKKPCWVTTTGVPRNHQESQMALLLSNKHLSKLRKDQTFDCLQLNCLPISVQVWFTSEGGSGLLPLLTL